MGWLSLQNVLKVSYRFVQSLSDLSKLSWKLFRKRRRLSLAEKHSGKLKYLPKAQEVQDIKSFAAVQVKPKMKRFL